MPSIHTVSTARSMIRQVRRRFEREFFFEILSAASAVDLDAIWVGRDLGHRGGRRTGLALTDDIQFAAHTRRWGVEAERPTRGPMLSERTASVVWEMLGPEQK